MFSFSKLGDLERLQILFQNNVDFNQSDYDGRTALHLAVWRKSYRCG